MTNPTACPPRCATDMGVMPGLWQSYRPRASMRQNPVDCTAQAAILTPGQSPDGASMSESAGQN
jgi:hypothetical protein